MQKVEVKIIEFESVEQIAALLPTEVERSTAAFDFAIDMAKHMFSPKDESAETIFSIIISKNIPIGTIYVHLGDEKIKIEDDIAIKMNWLSADKKTQYAEVDWISQYISEKISIFAQEKIQELQNADKPDTTK